MIRTDRNTESDACDNFDCERDQRLCGIRIALKRAKMKKDKDTRPISTDIGTDICIYSAVIDNFVSVDKVLRKPLNDI